MYQVSEGKLFISRGNRTGGFTENERGFKSLDELFNDCMNLNQDEFIDSMTIYGRDKHGHLKEITFSFQRRSQVDEDEETDTEDS